MAVVKFNFDEFLLLFKDNRQFCNNNYKTDVFTKIYMNSKEASLVPRLLITQEILPWDEKLVGKQGNY
jgi:hypothetical protein